MKNFRDLYRNCSDASRIEMNAVKANVQEKKVNNKQYENIKNGKNAGRCGQNICS